MTVEEMIYWMLVPPAGENFETNDKIMGFLDPYDLPDLDRAMRNALLAGIAVALDAFSRFGLPIDIAQLREV